MIASQGCFFLFIFSFLFFPFYHCLSYWPQDCEPNGATKASCGRLNIISLTETSDLFCMWSMKKCETVCPQYRLTVTTHTYIHTSAHALSSLSFGCLVSGKNSLFCLPKGIALLVLPDGLVFLFYSPSLMLSLNILLFSITCSFCFRENHQTYTIESLFFAPCHPTHSRLSPFCTLLHQNCAS